MIKAKGNKKKMLTSLSIKFIRFFLEKKVPVSLEDAATAFCQQSIRKDKIKTKIRRLYDISNVLAALGLIQKIQTQTKRSVFEWIGLKGFLKVRKNITKNSLELNIKTTD
jgi:transcription factor E2F7/8